MEGAELVTLEEGWARLRVEGIEKIQKYLDQRSDRSQSSGRICVVSNQDYASIYTMVYTMCTQRSPYNFSQDLYQLYGDSIIRYVHSKVLPALEGLHGNDLLQELLRRWDNHRTLVKWLQKFFVYLDRYYVVMHMEAPLMKRGISIFKEHVFDSVKQPVSLAIDSAIRKQRDGEMLDEETIAQLVCMYIGLDPEEEGLSLYQRELEDLILASTKEYYDQKAKEWIASSTFSEYLRLTEEAIDAEARRCERYLHCSTSGKLLGVVVRSTLQQQQQLLLDKDTAVPFLLSNERRSELRMAHRLFALLDGALGALAKQFKAYTFACGDQLVQQRVASIRETQELRALGRSSSSSSHALTQQQHRQQDSLAEHRFVQSVLDLHDKFKSLTTDCFRALPRSHEAASASSRVSLQVDPLFQKALKEGDPLNEEQMEDCLMKVVDMFNYVTDKDLFAEQYRSQLGRRLLHQTSASVELEKALIAKLRLKCGAHFTAKLEGMVTDLDVAADLMKSFHNHQTSMNSPSPQPETIEKQQLPSLTHSISDISVNSVSVGDVDFSVQTLSTTHWPAYPAPDLCLPRELSQCVSAFEQFYLSRTQHRKLTWVHSLGSAVLTATFDRSYEMVCSTLQAVLLLQFNRSCHLGGDSSCEGEQAFPRALSLDELVGRLHLEEILVKKLVGSLMLGRFKILKKASNDSFEVNRSFSCAHRKIKIPTPMQEETHCRVRVEEDRSTTVDAAIVRIMKTRKGLSHQQLVSEVMGQLQFFQPQQNLLNERIQDLIAREFLEKDKERAGYYNYVA